MASDQKAFWQVFSPGRVARLINFWPPYLGAGIKVLSVDPEVTRVKVRLKQTVFNTNYVGTHFGGSLYAMADPFYMFILAHHLHQDHIVWDKSASIDFIKPGRGSVYSEFHISSERVEEIRELAKRGDKVLPEFETYVVDEDGDRVAHIRKVLYVRKRTR